MPKHSLLISASLATLAFALSGCESPSASKNNLSAPKLNALGIQKAKAARDSQAAKVEAVEKTMTCEVKAIAPEGAPASEEKIEAPKPKQLRLGGRDEKLEESLFKTKKFGVTLLSNHGKLTLVIVDLATSKALAQSETGIASRSISLQHSLEGLSLGAHCQEAGSPKVDPGFDRTAFPWKCEGFLENPDSKEKEKQIKFVEDGSIFKADGPDGKIAELALQSESGAMVTLSLRKAGETAVITEGRSDDSTGFLILDAALPGGKIRAHAECRRKNNKRSL